jgi:ribosome-associated protein
VTELKPSKSAKKREYLALQKLGEELITLRESELAGLPLDEDLLLAIRDAQQITARGAMRRQKQFIGKLMRHLDPEPLIIAMAKLRR